MSETIAAAVNKALAGNEVGVENLANKFRLLFLCAVGVLALVNAPLVERVSNEYNFGALAVAFLYGGGQSVLGKLLGSGKRVSPNLAISCAAPLPGRLKRNPAVQADPFFRPVFPTRFPPS